MEALHVGAHAADGQFEWVNGVLAKGRTAAPGDDVQQIAFHLGEAFLHVAIAQGRRGLHGHAVLVGQGEDALGRRQIGSEGLVYVGRFAARKDVLAQGLVYLWIGGREHGVAVDVCVQCVDVAVVGHAVLGTPGLARLGL